MLENKELKGSSWYLHLCKCKKQVSPKETCRKKRKNTKKKPFLNLVVATAMIVCWPVRVRSHASNEKAWSGTQTSFNCTHFEKKELSCACFLFPVATVHFLPVKANLCFSLDTVGTSWPDSFLCYSQGHLRLHKEGSERRLLLSANLAGFWGVRVSCSPE